VDQAAAISISLAWSADCCRANSSRKTVQRQMKMPLFQR